MSNSDPSTGTGKASTRDQILHAALACFAEKGYHKTTMDDIVAASGLSKGTLYWYFKSKQELFISLIDWFILGISEEATHAWTDDMPAADKIRTFIMTFAGNSERMAPFFKITLDFWAQTFDDDQLLDRFDTMLDNFQAQLSAIIETGVSHGEFRAIDAARLSLALIGMVDSLVLYKTLLGDKVDPQSSVDVALEALLRGLQP